MKKILKSACLFLLLAITACSKDDDSERVSERLEYEYTTEMAIPDGSGVAIINLEVNADKVVLDPSKVHIEFTLEHQLAIDVIFGYLMPNDGTEFRTIVDNLGGFNKYSRQNVLSFSPNNTDVINSGTDFHYPNNIIPAGNYKEGTNNTDHPTETPLFKSMADKNIKGTWKFFFMDDYPADQGKVIKIKLIFDEGALQN